jgi:UDP-N-acetyl-D-mannosaminuronic acid dehydrogenase
MADICVLGLGYVGLPTASLLASAGFRVLGVDINRSTVEALNSGQTHLQEAGLATLVSAACKSGNLSAATQVEPADLFLICVPTPVTERHGVDLRAVESAARAIAPVLRKGNLVILESTSPIGTTRNVVGRILQSTGLEPARDFDLCYCPERVLPGNTLHELINNDRIIGGYTPASAQRAAQIYERFCQGHISLTNDLTAELSKLAENTFRDVNIAVANVFARISEEAGINVWEAIRLANLHPRVKILNPGPGVGGHCIPVDPWFLVDAYPQVTSLLREARLVNDGQAARILDQVATRFPPQPGTTLTILGAAYKAEIDDSRESPAFHLAELAVAAGLNVAIHDPLVAETVYHGFPVRRDLRACLRGAACAVLMTDHKAYRTLSSTVFSEEMAGRLIYDSRNCLDHDALRQAGFEVLVCGNGATVPPLPARQRLAA